MFETIILGAGHDAVFGSTAANVLQGRDGNNTSDGGQGDEVLVGGVGTIG